MSKILMFSLGDKVEEKSENTIYFYQNKEYYKTL